MPGVDEGLVRRSFASLVVFLVFQTTMCLLRSKPSTYAVVGRSATLLWLAAAAGATR